MRTARVRPSRSFRNLISAGCQKEEVLRCVLEPTNRLAASLRSHPPKKGPLAPLHMWASIGRLHRAKKRNYRRQRRWRSSKANGAANYDRAPPRASGAFKGLPLSRLRGRLSLPARQVPATAIPMSRGSREGAAEDRRGSHSCKTRRSCHTAGGGQSASPD